MNAITSREQNMLMVTVVIVLYALAALSFKKQVASWKAAERVYQTAQKKLNEENALIAARGDWAARYEQVRERMPVFPYEKDVDTHWLNVMDSVATRDGLAIARRQTNKEAEVGDVYELPIDCKDWEGTLESLVKFLYDLNQEGAMLDVRQLYVRTSNKPGFLKGTFTLYCAYMRGKEGVTPAAEKQAPASPAPLSDPAAPTGQPARAVAPVPAPAPEPSQPAGVATNPPVAAPPPAAPVGKAEQTQ